jgi:hypothetical protein
MGWTDFLGDAVGGLGGFLKGAAGGALGGFGAAGPWGALGGGLLGGAAGAFGSNGSQQMNKQYDQYMKQFGNQQAPQMGPAAQSSNSGFRDNQRSLVTRLEAMANGQGPSLAAEQLKSATDRGMSQQASIAQSGRGNAGAANMLAANNMGRMQMQAAQDSAQGRIMEQQMALNQLGGAINQGRQSDEANSQFNAQQQNFQSQGNLEAKLRGDGALSAGHPPDSRDEGAKCSGSRAGRPDPGGWGGDVLLRSDAEGPAEGGSTATDGDATARWEPIRPIPAKC